MIPFFLGVALTSIFWGATLLIERARIENRIWREEYAKFKIDPRGYLINLRREFTECRIREEEAKQLKAYNPAADY